MCHPSIIHLSFCNGWAELWETAMTFFAHVINHIHWVRMDFHVFFGLVFNFRGALIGLAFGFALAAWMSVGAMIYKDEEGEIPKHVFWLYRVRLKKCSVSKHLHIFIFLLASICLEMAIIFLLFVFLELWKLKSKIQWNIPTRSFWQQPRHSQASSWLGHGFKWECFTKEKIPKKKNKKQNKTHSASAFETPRSFETDRGFLFVCLFF